MEECALVCGGEQLMLGEVGCWWSSGDRNRVSFRRQALVTLKERNVIRWENCRGRNNIGVTREGSHCVVSEKRKVAPNFLNVDRFGWRFKDHTRRLIHDLQITRVSNIGAWYGLRGTPQAMPTAEIIIAIGCRAGKIAKIRR